MRAFSRNSPVPGLKTRPSIAPVVSAAGADEMAAKGKRAAHGAARGHGRRPMVAVSANINPGLRRVFVAGVLGLVSSVALQAAEAGWKAGVATADITPDQPQWMAGYGGRTHPAEGTLQPLFIKVLA